MNTESITQEIPRPEDRKPWLSPREQVERLKSQGVRFEGCSEADAEEYLRNHANYCRLKSYRSNFPKHKGGKRDGMFIDLDFRMLIDLAEVDDLLCREMLPLTLNIERYIRKTLLEATRDRKEDGYSIVWDFAESGHCSLKPMPIWEFLEDLTFGRLILFYGFCAARFKSTEMKAMYHALQSVRHLRNCCAHNNSLLEDLRSGTSRCCGPRFLIEGLGEIAVGSEMRRTKLRSRRMQQIAATMYLNNLAVSEEELGRNRDDLGRLLLVLEGKSFGFPESSPVRSSLEFVSILIRGWYSLTNGL